MDRLSAAAQDVIARGMPLAKAARLNGVPRTTLRWRMAAMERELAGFAVVELDADGYYRVDNRKIIDGRIV